jgi:hypothetical protein
VSAVTAILSRGARIVRGVTEGVPTPSCGVMSCGPSRSSGGANPLSLSLLEASHGCRLVSFVVSGGW